MGRPDIYKHVKDLVRPALAPYGEKARLARMLGVAQSYINQWMDDGRHNPGADKFPIIAEFLGCKVADLFPPVMTGTKKDAQKSAGVTYPDIVSGVVSRSNPTPGDGTDATPDQARLLSAERELAVLRKAIVRLGTELVSLGHMGTETMRTTAKKRGPSGRR